MCGIEDIFNNNIAVFRKLVVKWIDQGGIILRLKKMNFRAVFLIKGRTIHFEKSPICRNKEVNRRCIFSKRNLT